MKKLSCIVASLIILIIIIVGITKCSFCFMDSCYFYSQAVRSKDIDIYEGVRKCFVGTCFWDGKSSEITIPDQYHGKPVTGLGGYYGTGAPVLCFVAPDNESYMPVEKVQFTLNMGKYISEINEIEWEQFSWINCPKENRTFYSKDGILYARENNVVVYDPARPDEALTYYPQD